jgi:hypothetical protein
LLHVYYYGFLLSGNGSSDNIPGNMP